MADVIVVSRLGKRFRRYHPDRPQTLKQALISGVRHLRPAEHVTVLESVSFRVAPGRMLGVIGRNGAGKSTLLRLVGGIGRPDTGSVTTRGRIGALLDLGAGFHPDLTGRENVFVTGVIAGLTRRDVAAQFDAIVAFAELEPAIDRPLRTYSSGMQLRLAFAVAAYTNPEILLIDEVLAVGDLAFQKKCLERIATFRSQGCAIMLVSHDAAQVRQLCDDVLWLRHGTVAAHGAAEVVVGQYVADVGQETRQRTPADLPVQRTASGAELRLNETRFGSLELEITGLRLLDAQGRPTDTLPSGAPLSIQIDYLAHQTIPAPIVGVTIRNDAGVTCLDLSTSAAGHVLPTAHGTGRAVLRLERLDLARGHYFVDVGIYEQDWAYAYDYHWHVYPLEISAARQDNGILSPPHSWEVYRPNTPDTPDSPGRSDTTEAVALDGHREAGPA